MSEPGDVILAATLPELSFTATAIPNANATLIGTLPALVFTAQAVPVTDAALAATFPPLAMVAEERYQSYAVRPITGQSVTRWQHASEHSAGVEDRSEATVREHAPTGVPTGSLRSNPGWVPVNSRAWSRSYWPKKSVE